MNIYEIMTSVKELKTKIIKRKKAIKEAIYKLNKQSNELVLKSELVFTKDDLNNIINKLKEIDTERDGLLKENKIIKTIDYNNEFTYSMLGKKVYQYEGMISCTAEKSNSTLLCSEMVGKDIISA